MNVGAKVRVMTAADVWTNDNHHGLLLTPTSTILHIYVTRIHAYKPLPCPGTYAPTRRRRNRTLRYAYNSKYGHIVSGFSEREMRVSGQNDIRCLQESINLLERTKATCECLDTFPD